jgi:glutamate-5-semialdehyde dehydrogenase
MSPIEQLAADARQAAARVATLATQDKDAVLLDLAAALEQQVHAVLAANARDLESARAAGLPDAKLRRLALGEAAIRQMADGLRQVAALPDPVGRVTRDEQRPSGLRVRKVRCPLGVILMIYEARPNVTVDAFALCFKAGNACLLKGGREALHSNSLLAELARGALRCRRAPEAALALLTTSDRDEIRSLLALEQYIDLAIPRGGAELIRFVHEHARVPTVQHFHGVCHIFVEANADLDRALDVCATAKTSAPATCNAVEAILVDRAVAERFVPRLCDRYARAGVEVRGDAEVCRLAPGARPAAEDDWGREFLDLIVAVRVVAGLDDAIAHIRRHGSNHTDAILTADADAAERFVHEVQSSCALVNASTRFNDGYQLGLGAEIGVSTSKIHAYGPMGLEELTTQRYVVTGDYQTR